MLCRKRISLGITAKFLRNMKQVGIKLNLVWLEV